MASPHTPWLLHTPWLPHALHHIHGGFSLQHDGFSLQKWFVLPIADWC
jgi:hypothetical protein